jgi:3-oxo-5-alpha-steroid 4-dehydrogenase 1
MSEWQLFSTMTWVLLAIAPASFVLLTLIPAPYGRHVRPGWGPQLSSRVGWFAMETPAVLVFAWAFFSGDRWLAPAPLALFALWQLHYVHRAWIYPFRTRAGRPMTLLVAAFVALLVTGPYGYLNGRQLSQFGEYPASWLHDVRFVTGAALFLVGFIINFHSDSILIRLRRPGETGHKLPVGGLFRWLSCPNYFGELVEWAGWAIATWSLPGLAFALWGAANLVPRARANHRWYRDTFPDYPPERRALLPRFR